jgi:hypothetical protein
MPRSYKKKVSGRSYQNYDHNIIKNAVDAVRYKKITIRRASEAFEIPKSTICDHLNTNKMIKKPGGQPIFNTDEESQLVEGL